MTIPEILKELEAYTGRFPREAMQAAIEQREAITPELLSVLEAVAANPSGFATAQDYGLHLFAMFLLAQFREKRAYPLIVQMFSAPGDTSYHLAGETVCDGLDRILASVYDGNAAPLRRMVESEVVDEYVRAAAIDTFAALERTGQVPRAEVVEYYRSLFQGKLQRTHSFAWDGLVGSVSRLPAPELLEDVRRAYAENLADSTVADLESIERDLAAQKPGRSKSPGLVTEAINDMEWWAAFHPEDSHPEVMPEPPEARVPLPPPPPPPPESYTVPKPFVREPKIGRNDPCPCGSGKKYKKCCGKG